MLVLGASGGLGQRVVQALEESNEISVVVRTCSISSCAHDGNKQISLSSYIPVDVSTAAGLDRALANAGNARIVAVVNCAAIASPAVCEQDSAKAHATNIPAAILQKLFKHFGSDALPLFVQLSTDNVYSGMLQQARRDHMAAWRETDSPAPVNVYGQSKANAEKLLLAEYPHNRLVIFRASAIVHEKNGFLQMIRNKLRNGEDVNLLLDEKRSFVDANDVVDATVLLCKNAPEPKKGATIFNAGGPESLSRLDFGVRVAQALGSDCRGSIVAAASTDVVRGYQSPNDLTMDSTRFTQLLPHRTPRRLSECRIKELCCSS